LDTPERKSRDQRDARGTFWASTEEQFQKIWKSAKKELNGDARGSSPRSGRWVAKEIRRGEDSNLGRTYQGRGEKKVRNNKKYPTPGSK
jgi:hypothetical protein